MEAGNTQDGQRQTYDVAIIGAGCAGLTAGIYAGRAKLKTAIFEKQQPGGQAATTDEIANYPGFEHITGPELMERMAAQAQSFGAELITADVTKVNLKTEPKTITAGEQVYHAHTVIIATGANPKKLGFEGEETFRGRGVGYCATCDGFFFQGKDIFVIGGGYSAAEEALYLTRFGKKVTVVVRKDQFKCAQSIVDKVMADPKIEVWFNTELVRAYGDSLLKGAVFRNNVTGEEKVYEVSEEDGIFGIFVFVGYTPDTKLFTDQLTLDEYGYIDTEENMRTELPGVFAAGDVRKKQLRQLVTATSDGAIAAVGAEKFLTEFQEKNGTPVDELEEVQKGRLNEYPPDGKKDVPYRRTTDPDGGKNREPAGTGLGHSENTKPGHSSDTVTEHSGNTHDKSGSTESKLLTPQLREQVREIFSGLKKSVEMIMIADPKNPKSEEMETFLKDFCSLGSQLTLHVYRLGENKEAEEKIQFNRVLSVALLDENGCYTGIKFSGIPAGHEFNSLVMAVCHASGLEMSLSGDLRKRIESIEKDVYIQIAVSLSCHFCPEVVMAAQQIAVLNPNVQAEMVDIGCFPDLRQQYNIMSVPAVIINQSAVTFGKKTVEELLEIIEKTE